jgi:dUTP pyrophosphatase
MILGLKNLSNRIRRFFTKSIRIEVLFKHPDAQMPYSKRSTDAGYDLYSLIDCDIAPSEIVSLNTGHTVVAPPGYYLTVEGRSSLYKCGVTPFRGIIDGTYCGPMIVSLMNVGKEVYHIKKGDRIAQLVPHKLVKIHFQKVDKISPEYNIRGESGWGSSGR